MSPAPLHSFLGVITREEPLGDERAVVTITLSHDDDPAPVDLGDNEHLVQVFLPEAWGDPWAVIR